MATKSPRPVRTICIFLAVIAILFGAAAAIGQWKPRLGLDLRGGTRITLQASALSGGVTGAKLNQAVQIITSRVNGLGVTEASVSTQGSDIIVVEIPGKADPDISRSIGETAQLRFRLVAKAIGPLHPQKQGNGKVTYPKPQQTPTPAAPTAPASPPASPKGSAPPSAPASPPASSPPSPSSSASPSKSKQTEGKKRPAAQWMSEDNGSNGKKSGSDSSGQKSDTTTPEPAPPALQPPHLVTIKNPYAWVRNPPQQWLSKLQSFKCSKSESGTQRLDLPGQPLLACDAQGNRYLLGPAMVEGTHVDGASYGIPQNQVSYVVNVNFDGTGAKKFYEVTKKIAKNNTASPNSGEQLAIVLDGQVKSAPVNDDPIPGGQAQISGSDVNPFTQQEAQNLANVLKYGALPLSFSVQQVSDQGPELAGNQLDAGILAGIIGLILVMLYALFYYRGLFVVVVSSLGIAGLLVYACVLLLGHAYGFTLSLPGVAGLIVAVGITADSFIVYFERLRDEVRDGRTLRTSVETGWKRARQTILAADGVSVLAALMLYIFAIGDVKGFAFTLGLTTVIDVFVVFFFTHPIMTLLARTHFYGKGHKFSGLDREHLGMPPLRKRPRAAGGEA